MLILSEAIPLLLSLSKKFSLSHNSLTHKISASLSSSLRHHLNLRIISLNRNLIGSQGIQGLVDGLKENNIITKLG